MPEVQGNTNTALSLLPAITALAAPDGHQAASSAEPLSSLARAHVWHAVAASGQWLHSPKHSHFLNPPCFPAAVVPCEWAQGKHRQQRLCLLLPKAEGRRPCLMGTASASVPLPTGLGFLKSETEKAKQESKPKCLFSVCRFQKSFRAINMATESCNFRV